MLWIHKHSVDTMTRDKSLRIRVTEQEHEMLERARVNMGLRHISEAVRVLADRAARLQSEQPDPQTGQPQPDRP